MAIQVTIHLLSALGSAFTGAPAHTVVHRLVPVEKPVDCYVGRGKVLAYCRIGIRCLETRETRPCLEQFLLADEESPMTKAGFD